MAGPLEGIRILDWTQWQQGPVATAMLADLGAEVIHIELPVAGDGGRGLKLVGKPEQLQGRTAYFECNNRGKRSITLDLAKEKGQKVLYRLVKNSDVFVHNFRQGMPERLGLDYETLCQYNPKLIYAAASGFGPKGPDAKEPAFDYIGLARSGIMTMMGEADMPPLLIQLGIADQMGAIMTAYGVLAAIIARERLGVGQQKRNCLVREFVGDHHQRGVPCRLDHRQDRDQLLRIFDLEVAGQDGGVFHVCPQVGGIGEHLA